MAQKIVMLGGRRAGKSTILASIIEQLSSETHSDICVFEQVIEEDTEALFNKTRELEGIMSPDQFSLIEPGETFIRPDNAEFIVDMNPSVGIDEYQLRCNLSYNQSVTLSFYDAPGEAMAMPNKNEKDPKGELVFPNPETNVAYNALMDQHNQLKSIIPNTDVFVIVIDTPFLMEATPAQNKIYNRIEEINNLLTANIRFDETLYGLDKKLILFCPVKCEKWIHENKIDSVIKKIKIAYKSLIDKCAQHPDIEMYILPIQTAGNLEFSSFKSAKLLKNESQSLECAYSPKDNMITLRSGEMMLKEENQKVVSDTRRWYFINGNKIPSSWYRVINQGVFAPKNCEQVAYYILRFLVNKEIAIKEAKHKNLTWWEKIKEKILTIWQPSFGELLEDYKLMVQKLEDRHLIKINTDGICKIEIKKL